MSNDIRIEGIRPTNAGSWVIVGSKPGSSVVPGRSPRMLTTVREFRGIRAEFNCAHVARGMCAGIQPPLFDPAAWQRSEERWT